MNTEIQQSADYADEVGEISGHYSLVGNPGSRSARRPLTVCQIGSMQRLPPLSDRVKRDSIICRFPRSVGESLSRLVTFRAIVGYAEGFAICRSQTTGEPNDKLFIGIARNSKAQNQIKSIIIISNRPCIVDAKIMVPDIIVVLGGIIINYYFAIQQVIVQLCLVMWHSIIQVAIIYNRISKKK